MLTLEEKILLFKKLLCDKKGNYADLMKDEIYFYFFENERGFDFLKSLDSKNQINNKVDFLVNKMIMHEQEDGLQNIIENHIL